MPTSATSQPRRVSPVGSHVAVAGGLIKTGLGEATEIGAEVIQVFAGNPRGWRPTPFDRGEDDEFRTACAELGIAVFVHAPYLLNFGSPTPATVENSAAALAYVMGRAESLGVSGVVVHTGSSVQQGARARAFAQVHEVIPPILDAAPDGVRLLVEPTAGGGAALASTIDSTLEYLDALADERVGVCLDTCHLHAAGEDVTGPDELAAVLTRLTGAIGVDRLGLIHVNDSRDAAGSHRDRHESLGAGLIGERAFTALFSTPELRGVPLLVETATPAADVALLAKMRATALGALPLS
ncbi:deoxyribonuclease IV [Nocardia sp. SYP-A9097]|uniref:deoxyribonuclease IV n=1 Tax=Nocardia sp. SYP-A9097 TaxID=2663237 RepID=UPI00129AF425|nr:deoxyribonuclease IV [Nocardia sp. SYP-A9097]MRH92420.1 deoxyribonuclease IV [Nocardia sp. SYP-A9097]